MSVLGAHGLGPAGLRAVRGNTGTAALFCSGQRADREVQLDVEDVT